MSDIEAVVAAVAADAAAAPPAKKLPVTVLSGFLGAGKTTLLKHILTHKGDLRCAVIVNDMAELNVDAALVKNADVLQREEKLVQMQNGCICCTLREDLLVELRNLAAQDKFDCIVIESTGISEPQQVAETFFFEWDKDQPLLNTLAQLDTCVTVVDAANMLTNMQSLQSLSERKELGPVEEEDERNVADLMFDQLEFADVVVLNKVDLVKKKQIDSLTALIKKLNPRAEVIASKKGKVDLSKILKTGKFDLTEATMMPGWLVAIRDEDERKPESVEYGISSFVYRARRPFHPQRIFDWMNNIFVVNQTVVLGEDEEEPGEDGEDGEDGEEMEADDENADGSEAMDEGADAADDDGEWETEDEDDGDDGDDGDAEEQAKEMAKELKAAYGNLLRSKGFVWVAGGNNDVAGWEWGQAGLVLTLEQGSPWYCVLPRDRWGQNGEPSESLVAAIEKDFVDQVICDRRNELVFIGQNVKRAELIRDLDSCLLNDEEWQLYLTTRLQTPGFCAETAAPAPWDDSPFDLVSPSLKDVLEGDQDDGHDHNHA